MVSTPQLSKARAAEKLAVAKHSPASVFTFISAGQAMIGASLSSIVITVVQVVVWPLPSSTVHTTVVSPVGSTSPARVSVPLRSLVMLPSAQLSVNVASNSVPTIVYSHTPASVSRVASATQVIKGASLSSTVITVVQVAVWPLPSSTDQIKVVK